MALLLGLCLTHASLLAQGVPPTAATVLPNSEALQRESQRQFERLQRGIDQRRPTIDGPIVEGAETPETEGAKPGGPKFKLQRVVFSDSSFLSRSELAAISSQYVGREIDLAALYEIVGKVNAIYAERGLITALATLPPQKIKNGLVRIKLTEGRLGKTLVSGSRTLGTDYIANRVDIPAGVVIDPQELNKKISYFNRTNSAQIRALLQPGSTFGLTDIQYAVFEPATNTLQVYADNEGVESTGRYQFGGFFRRYGLLGMDDRLTVYASNARKTLNANIAYNFPIDTIGSRLGVSYSRGSMAIVQGPFVDLDVEGKSQSASLNYTRPLLVTSDWLIQASLAATAGESRTTYSEVTVTDTDTFEATPGLSFHYSNDNFVGQVSPAFSIVRSRGKVLDESRNFPLFKGTGGLLWQLPRNLSVKSDFSWQTTGAKLLPGGQLFQIGGPTTVRGYPANAAAGDSGYLVNLELHRSLADWREGVGIFTFVDHGGVFSTFPYYRQATSIGAGMDVQFSSSARLELSIARPLKQVIPDQDDFQAYARFSLSPEW